MTKIEWTNATWNPIAGCSVVSPGCTNCYAMQMAARVERMMVMEKREGVRIPHHYTALTKPSKAGPVWTGRVNIATERIFSAPLKRHKPTLYFVNSMSDLFHESVPEEWILRILDIIRITSYDGGSNVGRIGRGEGQHTYQVLTKRSARMRDVMNRLRWDGETLHLIQKDDGKARFVLKNLWLGVSCEDQRRADERIPDLLATPAAVRFVSAEPLLSSLDLSKWLHDGRRESISGPGCSGAVHGREDLRHDLALGEVDRGRDRLWTDLHTAGARGTKFRTAGQLPASDVQGWQEPAQDFGSSHRVDGFQSSTHPGFDGNQSHRRQQTEQRAIELGTCHSSAKRPALPYASRTEEEGSARDKELGGSGDRISSAGDPLHLGKPVSHTARNRSEVPDHASDRVGYCSAQKLDPPSLSWIIVGGESGFDARPMHPDWARSIRDQCTRAGVPFFFKQWGAWARDDNYKGNPARGVAIATPDGRVLTGRDITPGTEGVKIWKRGKRVNGRVMDGRIWEEMPHKRKQVEIA